MFTCTFYAVVLTTDEAWTSADLVMDFAGQGRPIQKRHDSRTLADSQARIPPSASLI